MKPTTDDVLKWALEAGFERHDYMLNYPKELESFAALAYAAGAAAMKERCAKVCESLFDAEDHSCDEAEQCAVAIRALGDEE